MASSENPRRRIVPAAEASQWFRLHSEDIGREIVIIDNPEQPCSPEVLEAWAGVGRWEAGMMAGRWPHVQVILPLPCPLPQAVNCPVTPAV